MITRRIVLTSIAFAAYPMRARGQHRQWRIGFLALPSRPNPFETSRFGAFERGMRDLGYKENEDVHIDWRFADGEVGRLGELARELVGLRVDIIVAGATPAIKAAQQATSIIPIVMAANNDPVGSGFVQSLLRPGGNITGLSNLSTDLSPKLIELVQSIAPDAARVAVLLNPENASGPAVLANLQGAMQKAGIASASVDATTASDIDKAFESMLQRKTQLVIVAPDSDFVERRSQIAELALSYRLPSVFSFREHVEAGGLLSYGEHLADSYRRAATFVDRIIKGARPSDLPVEQSTKLELLINLKTAKALGLTVSPALLARADDLIE